MSPPSRSVLLSASPAPHATPRPATALDEAAAALRAGRFVLLYDSKDREAEVDLFFAAEHVDAAAVERLRRDAGGLVFLAVAPEVGSKLGLPFLQDIFAKASGEHPVLSRLIPNDIRYDTRSSFSLTINHRETFTGITDEDRALTISTFGRLAKDAHALVPEAAQARFGREFRAPGHVHLCVGAEGLLQRRKGHTELAVALAEVAGVTPVLAGAEMLGSGRALPLESARAYAARHGAVLLEGREVEAAWRARRDGPTAASGSA